MTNKTKDSEENKQLSLFDIEDNSQSQESDYDWLEDDDVDFGFETSDRTIETAQELLTYKLLREAIEVQNPDDEVMADFAKYVLPNLLQIAIGVTAKGGKYFDKLDREKEAEGKAKV